MLSKAGLVVVFSAFTVARVRSQSCVQVIVANLSSCPCDQATLAFTLEGQTTVAANAVNLALVLDGSGSIDDSEFLLEKNFSQDAVAAFAARNLFDNGGTASYVQYSDSVSSSATFNSSQAFNAFVDADTQVTGGTNTATGITEGRALLAANAASASFMIVITDGESADSPGVAADEARADGIVVFAVGVGSSVNTDELLEIGGDAANVFSVTDFNVLDAALEGILSSNGSSLVSCASTGATAAVEFSEPVDLPTSSSGSLSGSTATFSAADLESTPTDFQVGLDLCGTAAGDSIVVSANYTDDQGNTPDLSLLTGVVVGEDLCAAPTLAPSLTPTEAPLSLLFTAAPTLAGIRAPVGSPKKDPKKNGLRKGRNGLHEGRAKGAKYLGCYMDDSKHPTLTGAKSGSNKMTAQMCADTCSAVRGEYFGTSFSSECSCGNSQPAGKGTQQGGACDYPCSGDNSVACGGYNSISIYQFYNF